MSKNKKMNLDQIKIMAEENSKRNKKERKLIIDNLREIIRNDSDMYDSLPFIDKKFRHKLFCFPSDLSTSRIASVIDELQNKINCEVKK